MCREYKLACCNWCWQTCWIATLLRWWSSSASLMAKCEVLPLQPLKKTYKTFTFAHLTLDFYTFQQDSAPAHTACEMVEFLDREMPDFMPRSCFVLMRWTFFISEPEKINHRSMVVIDSTSWGRQACTHDTLWCQRFITTSKDYLTNRHILLKYFELVFLKLLLVKKFHVNWSPFDWVMKKGAFLWNTVYTTKC